MDVTETVNIDNQDRGNIGEALVVGSRQVPRPLQNAVHGFIEENYSVGTPSGFISSLESVGYIQVRTDSGGTLSWKVDGMVTCEWISEEKAAEVEELSVGGFSETRPQDQLVEFPLDVKTGEYAELSDRQQGVVNAVAEADNNVHPTIVKVEIDDLPDQYALSARIIDE